MVERARKKRENTKKEVLDELPPFQPRPVVSTRFELRKGVWIDANDYIERLSDESSTKKISRFTQNRRTEKLNGSDKNPHIMGDPDSTTPPTNRPITPDEVRKILNEAQNLTISKKSRK